MKSLFPDICSDDIAASKTFYESLFGFQTVYQIDWYVQLQSPRDPNVQLAFVSRNHPSVPEDYRDEPRGVIVTVETDDVDASYARAQQTRAPIVLSLRDEAWGQRHYMSKDPNGLLVDVVQLIQPTQEFLDAHGL